MNILFNFYKHDIIMIITIIMFSFIKILKNEIMMNKLINSMQLNLYKLEQNEYKDISMKSNSEAVEVALLLASHPAPPMPIFPLDSQYYNAESLANKVDDIFSKDNLIQGGEYYQDIIENKNSNKDLPEHHEETLTDSEAMKLCTDMKIKYNVKVGISWGDLPYDLQQQWLEHSCDYHLSDDNNITTINNKIEDKEEENSLDKF